IRARRTRGSPALSRPESRNARGKMFESARGPAARRAPRAQQLALTTETSVLLHENPAGLETNPRKPLLRASRAENRVPSPAFVCRQGYPARRRQTHPGSPDIAVSSAPCRGPAARCAHREIPCAAFLPNALSLLQKNKRTSTGTLDIASGSAGSNRNSG